MSSQDLHGNPALWITSATPVSACLLASWGNCDFFLFSFYLFIYFWSRFGMQLRIPFPWNLRKQLEMKFEKEMIERWMGKYIFTDSPEGFPGSSTLHTWVPLLKSVWNLALSRTRSLEYSALCVFQSSGPEPTHWVFPWQMGGSHPFCDDI